MNPIRTAALATVMLFGFGGIAHAGLSDTYSFTLWSAPGGPADVATISDLPAGPPSAQFDYAGPLDLANNNTAGGANSAGDFFTDPAALTQFVSPNGSYAGIADFLAHDTLSDAGGTQVTFMLISGSYTEPAGTNVTIAANNDAALYAITTNGTITVGQNGSTGALPAGSQIPFELIYVQAGGAPASLDVSVPEPGSLVVLGTGLLALAALLRRKRR